MKKIKPFTIALLGLPLTFIFTLVVKTQSELDILNILIYPVSKTFETVSQLSMSSYLGNVLAWFILIAMFAAPILILRLKSKERFEAMNLIYFVLSTLLLIFSIITIKGSVPQRVIDPVLLKYMQLFVISFSYYLLWLGVFYELYIGVSKTSYDNVTTLKLILNIMSLIIALHLGHQIGTLFIQNETVSLWSWFDIFLKIFINSFIFKALFKMYALIEQDRFEWVSDNTLLNLSEVSSLMNKAIFYSIYLTILTSILGLFTLTIGSSVHININLPVVEIIISLTLSLFISVITASIPLKKENEQFI